MTDDIIIVNNSMNRFMYIRTMYVNKDVTCPVFAVHNNTFQHNNVTSLKFLGLTEFNIYRTTSNLLFSPGYPLQIFQ